MAFATSDTDRSHSFTGNFSVLEGVMVKVSDKYRPPKKVNLPYGWIPIEYKNVDEFDFKFEEDVIMLAKEDELQHEKEREKLEAAKVLQESETSNDFKTDTMTVNGSNEELLEDDKEDTSANLLGDINKAPILEPVRINSDPLALKENKNSLQSFNFSEFEENFDTPFELVELQTIDDIDELKSVLEPSAKDAKAFKTKKAAVSSKEEGDVDFSIFTTPVDITANSTKVSADKVATGSLIPDIEPFRSLQSDSMRPLAITNGRKYAENISISSSPSNMTLDRPSVIPTVSDNGITQKYPRNIHTVNHGLALFPKSHPSSVLATTTIPVVARGPVINSVIDSKRYPLYNFSDLDITRSGRRHYSGEETFIHRKASISNETTFPLRHDDAVSSGKTGGSLNRLNSKSLPNLADACIDASTSNTQNLQRKPQEPEVSTSRIDNIMKQFQLNRLREFDGPNDQSGPPISSENHIRTEMMPTSDSRPISRHGMLPPLPNSPRSLSSSSNFSHPNHFDERSKRFQSLEDSGRQSNLAACEVLPPITPSPPLTPVASSPNAFTLSERNCIRGTSWLPDPTLSLSPKESSFASMITGMGFPKARTARAVERLKYDEKEIIDFLIRVQQVADLGYDADDVEMAIINSGNEQDNIMNYLNVANKWKELGFPVHKVHDALKNTNRENEPMFEYLTT